jgi:anti-sigma regulatory factor (Ser/Thr protein kinase)
MVLPENRPRQVLDLRVPATPVGMDVVHTALAGCWEALRPLYDLAPRWCDEFSLAVAEVSANIIQHAHAPDPPLVDFALSLTSHPNYLTACFVDSGVVATPPAAPIMPSVAVSYAALGERGRGLALVQLTTDRFAYLRTPDGQNIWTIEKSLPPPALTAPPAPLPLVAAR